MGESVVCIFPHSDKEFPTPEALREFLSHVLPMPPQEGRYLFGKIGWKDRDFVDRVIPGSLVLFAKKGFILGRAIASTVIRELDPPEEGETETGEKAFYNNEIFFVPTSIRVCRQTLLVEQVEKCSDRKHNLRSYRILGFRRDFEKTLTNFCEEE